MASEMSGLYLGIDIDAQYTMLSFYQQNMTEPQTISTVMGSESYQIPTILAKKRGIGQWYFGREATLRIKSGEALCVEKLFESAYKNEEVFVEHEKYFARDLLAIFIKRIFSMAGSIHASLPLAKVVVCVDGISTDYIELFGDIFQKIGIEKEKILLIDRKESFYYYALSQSQETFLHDVVMFDYTKKNLQGFRLHRNLQSTPQVITIEESDLLELKDNKDEEFLEKAKTFFAGRVVSAVYLIGDGFDGDWMKTSLQFLCHTRKVFLGKNLYSKGACYAGFCKDNKDKWPFVYMGDNELKVNLYLKVLIRNEMQFFTLLNAGESWFEQTGECEVILDGSPEIEVWIQEPDSREAHVQLLEMTDMTDLANRPPRTTRLRISAHPLSDKSIQIQIRDLGFGEIVPPSNKVWEHIVCIE